MSPTYTMSAHLCKEIYKSFQTRQTSPEPLSNCNNNIKQANYSSYTTTPLSVRRSPSPEKRSMDSDRSSSDSSPSSPSAMSRSSSQSSWKWGSGR